MAENIRTARFYQTIQLKRSQQPLLTGISAEKKLKTSLGQILIAFQSSS
jgi:hypothetical protein